MKCSPLPLPLGPFAPPHPDAWGSFLPTSARAGHGTRAFEAAAEGPLKRYSKFFLHWTERAAADPMAPKRASSPGPGMKKDKGGGAAPPRPPGKVRRVLCTPPPPRIPRLPLRGPCRRAHARPLPPLKAAWQVGMEQRTGRRRPRIDGRPWRVFVCLCILAPCALTVSPPSPLVCAGEERALVAGAAAQGQLRAAHARPQHQVARLRG